MLKDGNVFIAGGEDGEDSTGTADLYDSAADSFAPTRGNMSAARAYAAATLLPNGKVLIAGGLNSTGKILSSADLYTPPLQAPAMANASRATTVSNAP